MIRLRLIDDETRLKAIEKIREGVRFDFQYFTLFILSIIIATLGLIINNGAIVIGAMIICPFIWPVIGLSLAMVTGNMKLLRKSAFILLISIVIAVSFSTIISLFSPFQDLNTEISARISPTIIDLIIALATGLVAVLIMCWSRLFGILAGVAVAASLLPPISVTGIGLAFWRMNVAYGSFLLFLTNLVAVIFVGMIAFALLGFARRKHLDKIESFKYGLLILLIFIILLSIPLVIILRQLMYENTAESAAREIIYDQLNDISSEIKIDSLDMATFKLSSPSIDITSVIHAPADVRITLEEKNAITQELSDALNKEINLSLTIIPTLSATTPKVTETEEERLQRQAEEIVLAEAANISTDIEVELVKIDLSNSNGQGASLETVWRVPEELNIDYSVKDNLAQSLSAGLAKSIDLEINVIRYLRVEKQLVEATTEEKIEESIDKFLAEKSEDISVLLIGSCVP